MYTSKFGNHTYIFDLPYSNFRHVDDLVSEFQQECSSIGLYNVQIIGTTMT